MFDDSFTGERSLHRARMVRNVYRHWVNEIEWIVRKAHPRGGSGET
jgi:hypothetical protein